MVNFYNSSKFDIIYCRKFKQTKFASSDLMWSAVHKQTELKAITH